MASTYLFLDRPVSQLQLDILTTGTASPDSSLAAAGKSLSQNPVGGGYVRLVIFGLNTDTFSGKFAVVNAAVSDIRNVVGSSPDGSNANPNILRLGSVLGVTCSVQLG